MGDSSLEATGTTGAPSLSLLPKEIWGEVTRSKGTNKGTLVRGGSEAGATPVFRPSSPLDRTLQGHAGVNAGL